MPRPLSCASVTVITTIMQIEIRQLPRKRLAMVRHVGPDSTILTAFQRLGTVAVPVGSFGPGVEMIGVYAESPMVTPGVEPLTQLSIAAE